MCSAMPLPQACTREVKGCPAHVFQHAFPAQACTREVKGCPACVPPCFPRAGMHPGGAGGTLPASQEQTAAAAANAAAVAAAAVLHHSGAEPSAETMEQARRAPPWLAPR